jgi:TrkA domain protein
VPEIRETPLPGVGLRHEFATRTGERVGVVSHRTGRRELLLYDARDPDATQVAIDLTAEESAALAELLGGSRVTESLARLQQQVEGLAIDWVPIPAGSPFAGSTIGTAGIRSTTGVSIVAVLRQGTAFPAPGPQFALRAGDTALVVGTSAGIEALIELLEG